MKKVYESYLGTNNPSDFERLCERVNLMNVDYKNGFYAYFKVSPSSTVLVKTNPIYEIGTKHPRNLRKDYQYINFTGDSYLQESVYRLLNLTDSYVDDDFILLSPFRDLKMDKASFSLASPIHFLFNVSFDPIIKASLVKDLNNPPITENEFLKTQKWYYKEEETESYVFGLKTFF